MAGISVSCDEVIARLIEMGFDNSSAIQAVKEVGPSFNDAVDFILNDSCRHNTSTPTSSSTHSTSNGKDFAKRNSHSNLSSQTRQSSILDHFHSTSKTKRSRIQNHVDEVKNSSTIADCSGNLKTVSLCRREEVDIGLLDWESRANSLLHKHFGYHSLKSFQKEALAAWVANQDCLVLAATGSGKSLCFQIPALLTGKVVVVISPLISLMHDQCLKLSRHGISACFLGSGQPDSKVEQKAMKGLYDIIYVCPETVLRLIKPLQGLAESRGIALFAIDEVHCVSKWGHDFRPDYRRLSLLRENFSTSNLQFLNSDTPLMALTATATIQVREDIIKSLRMSNETKIVVTSFFRPNLQFSVKHSRTSSPSSYEKDFCQLIDVYVRKKKTGAKIQYMSSKLLNDCSGNTSKCSLLEKNGFSSSDMISTEDEYSDDDEINLTTENGSTLLEGKELSVEYLENEVDVFQNVDDWDVACGEFWGQSPCNDRNASGTPETGGPPSAAEERFKLLQEPLGEGPSIIYVPTRKETLSIAKYLCDLGVKAAAYNASLPKSHLRRVHKEFHENVLQVVIATVAFGMGIDKSNVRTIIHYGWPQSLEAYYQEAGRAGRDGKLAECILYANLSKVPSLLPSKRSEDQTKQAYKMLSDCFRYGMNTSCCRAKSLVEYFGEDFSFEKCFLCDVCVQGPPAMQNLKAEASILMQIIAAQHRQSSFLDGSYDDTYSDLRSQRSIQKPNLKMFVIKIREHSQDFWSKDLLWWRGLARVMEGKGYIREGDHKIHVQLKFPEPTKLGFDFLEYERDQPFCVYPEADMLLSVNQRISYSTFADWGKGWADPEIRQHRLEKRQKDRKPRQLRTRKSNKSKPNMKTSRGRITAKLFKQK